MSDNVSVVENTCPILNVADLDVSLAYYVNVLGFKVDWRDEYSAGVSRDRGGIMLIKGSQGCPGTWLWVGVNDAARLHEEFLASGAKIRHAPLNYPWALEFKVEDPDGHVLRFGSGPIPGRAFDDWAE